MSLKQHFLNYLIYPAGRRFRSGGIADAFHRLLHYRLIVPIKRDKNNAVPVARGIGLGLAVSFTPTLGAQMLIVAILWVFQKRFFPEWRFNMLVAMAWTWVTNIFTAPFFYYFFFLTGSLLMGNGMGLAVGFDQFSASLNVSFSEQLSWYQSLWLRTTYLFRTWGIPMLLGSIPWIVLAWIFGYIYGLKFMTKLNRRRLEKEKRKKEKQERIETHG